MSEKTTKTRRLQRGKTPFEQAAEVEVLPEQLNIRPVPAREDGPVAAAHCAAPVRTGRGAKSFLLVMSGFRGVAAGRGW